MNRGEGTRGAKDLARSTGGSRGLSTPGGRSSRCLALEVWPGAGSRLNLASLESECLNSEVPPPAFQQKGRPHLIGALTTQRGYVGRPHYKLRQEEGLRWQLW